MRKRKAIVFDIDGTLCPLKNANEEYMDLKPYQNVVNKLKEFKKLGFEIILHTSRNMRTHNGSVGLINKYTAKVLLEWLDKNNIPYDEIYYGKPWAGQEGFYVDDRTIRPDEFVDLSFDEIQALIKQSYSK
jgi:capsule biosynthesis phosphatase